MKSHQLARAGLWIGFAVGISAGCSGPISSHASGDPQAGVGGANAGSSSSNDRDGSIADHSTAGASGASGASGNGALPTTDAQTGECPTPSVTPLFAAPAMSSPIVEQRADGVIVTRGAGRVRGRHELEGTYSEYGALYFENRTYGFAIEDHVAAGGSTLEINYEPEAPVSVNGAQTNFRCWKIYGDGNVFHTNITMTELSPQLLTHTVERNTREERELQVGDVLEFEFGVFIAGNGGGDPNAIEGRTAYYTDTFRYQVGVGGLTAASDDTSGTLGPSEDAMLGDATTIPWIYVEPELYFSQMVLNMQPEHVQAFVRGRRLFHTDFGSGEHSEAGNPMFEAQADKLGPMFSATRCSSCHERDGRGSPPAIGEPLVSMVVKLHAPDALGNQLQQQEGVARIEAYEPHPMMLGDGTMMMLQRPRFAFDGLGAVDAQELAPSIRIARQIPGMGLLEAIPEADILARADADDCDGDGISGRAQVIADPREPGVMHLGRIGWKAEKVSIAHQLGDALSADMGVSNPVFAESDGSTELAETDFNDLVTYTSLLALPARRNVDDAQVIEGAELFQQIGCVHCHAPSLTTGDTHPLIELRGQAIHPYSDLLLHEMGEDLADGSGTPQASEWRTAPLWGLGLVSTVSGGAHLLHDGRARDPIEAVLWHGGEATFAREAVRNLSAEQRQALLAFLQSL